MIDRESALARLRADLGLRRLSPVWAKLEIALGLSAVAAGIWFIATVADVLGLVGAVVLFVLGGYLAMAGHRSHVYQSNNLLAAYLAGEIRKLHSQRPVDEHPR